MCTTFVSQQKFSNFQMNNLNRQIIMQPKSIVAAGNSATGIVAATATSGATTIATMGGNVQTVSSAVINENAEDVQYFPRSTNNLKKIPVQGTANSPPTSHVDNVNVVFRAPVVSSSSNQSMRPPPPPPPKIKGHSEEPSSSIPDLGKSIYYSMFNQSILLLLQQTSIFIFCLVGFLLLLLLVVETSVI